MAREQAQLREAGIQSLHRVGDCAAPGIIAAAVYAGHRCARELGPRELGARELGANDVEAARDRVVVRAAE